MGQPGGDPREHVGVDPQGSQIPGVDADQPCSRGHRPLRLRLVVHLHEGVETRLARHRHQLREQRRVECGHDQQDQVRTVRTGLPHLVGVDHEVLAQHGQVHARADGVQIGEGPGEPPSLGQHADGRRASGRVGGGQPRGVVEGGEPAAGGAGPLDFGDHAQPGGRPQRRRRVGRGPGRQGQVPHRVQGHGPASLGEVGPDALDDRGEDAHHSPRPAGRTDRACRNSFLGSQPALARRSLTWFAPKYSSCQDTPDRLRRGSLRSVSA
ncbi:hypothetical protein STENM36S_08369 [Streptomyces tendae]